MGSRTRSPDPGAPPRLRTARRGLVTLALAAVIALTACTALLTRRPPTPELPEPDREFRGVWVATVDNIDWPSRPGLTPAAQRVEALAILDRCRDLNLNAVVLQVRPHCDALYPSELEPWSYYLTGRQGRAPDPLYDPLQFWIDESHARGLELHAWFNPYRANHPKHQGPLAPESMVRRRPDLVVKLGDEGYYWLDPGHPDTRAHTLEVIADVVRRYDVDGVHLDDYFYPYPSYNDGEDFPDEPTWQAYRNGGGRLSRGAWRRRNVDLFVEELYRQVKKEKRHVKVGISPFGIWRPGHPASIQTGFNQHDMIFADARRWLREGWVDYYTPQLYWPIAQVPQSFPVLLAWWAEQNPEGRHLWPGLFTSRVREGGWSAREVANQIMVTRALSPSGPGNVHFSMRSLLEDRRGPDSTSLGEELLSGPYRRRALPPPFPWLDKRAPAAPEATVHLIGDEVVVSWKPADEDRPFRYVVYWEQARVWNWDVLPAAQQSYRVGRPPAAKADDVSANDASADGGSPDPVTRVAIAGVDRSGNVGPAAVVELTPAGP